ncbi:hypothetical protein PUN28_005275 [Cardiocondyla obscurior]|uniref:LAGLIDADG homing endonuclease n=1 Tax=Cardiocondyla obscurior TaxID=286306 RepID=A0AAW2GJY3_9HYME
MLSFAAWFRQLTDLQFIRGNINRGERNARRSISCTISLSPPSALLCTITFGNDLITRDVYSFSFLNERDLTRPSFGQWTVIYRPSFNEGYLIPPSARNKN